jgi:hypothetical protein
MLPLKPQNSMLLINVVVGSADLEDVEYFRTNIESKAQRNRRTESMYIGSYYVSFRHVCVSIFKYIGKSMALQRILNLVVH